MGEYAKHDGQPMNCRGIPVSILKAGDTGDCTNGGVTSGATRAILVGEGLPELFDAGPGEPLLRLEDRGRHGFRAVPAKKQNGAVGPMFGGHFVWTSDSRFRAIAPYPVPVHDRYETAEMYARMSR